MLIALTCGFLAGAHGASAEAPQVLFNPKIFSDKGDIVHVEGTITGDGIGYKNNRTALTCYRQRRECLEVRLESEGFQVFSINAPAFFVIREWTNDRIIADLSAACGAPPSPDLKAVWQETESHTWIVNRRQETAEEVDHQCMRAKPYHWTIETPPFWRDQEKRSR